MNKLLIFGTGSNCKGFLEKNVKHLKRYNLVGFLDNNPAKQGELFEEKPIYAPKELTSLEYDYIYIASSFTDEIKAQLVNECQVDEKSIIPWWHFGIGTNLEINQKRVGKVFKNNDDLKRCRMVIYTAIFGKYDNLNDPTYVDDNCDYICFTDDDTLTSNIWDIRIVKDLDVSHTRKMAEKYSVLPHKFFPEYELSVYVDGNVLIHGDLREYAIKYMKHHNLLAFPHPWRCCAYDEAMFSMNYNPYVADNLAEMIRKYKEEGFPENMGMISAGILVRRHNQEDVMKAMECWWNEIRDNSSNDQVSFPYAAWKQNLSYDMSPVWIYKNDYVEILKHKKDLQEH